MLFDDWLQDKMTVYRNTGNTEGYSDSQVRTLIYSDIPCRIYEKQLNGLVFNKGTAVASSILKVAFENEYDIHAGDELLITREGESEAITYYAGTNGSYTGTLGDEDTGLEHKEVGISLTKEA